MMIGPKILLVSLLLFASASGATAADRLRKLTGVEIAATLSGMQFTDGVHWREVYERDGTARSQQMGRTSVGKWRLRQNELCVDYGSDGENNCFEVWQLGNKIIMQRDADDQYPNEGVLEKPTDPTPPASTTGKMKSK